jgi:hypothetical protein
VKKNRRYEMQPGAIYEEKILAKWLTAIFGSIAALMLFLLVRQVLVRPLVSRPALKWFFLVIFLLSVVLAFIFSRLTIRMTPASISVGYGPLGQTINWDNVADCFLDETSEVRYGGAGIRMTRIRGSWTIVYDVIESPRVVISLKEGRFKEVVFSTRHPQDVMKIINQLAHIEKD